MSRHLSSRPNLDHPKQAKDLLGDIRKGKPDWTLPDAQHAIVREYGLGVDRRATLCTVTRPTLTTSFVGHEILSVVPCDRRQRLPPRSAHVTGSAQYDAARVNSQRSPSVNR